jgi:hypothetical protein
MWTAHDFHMGRGHIDRPPYSNWCLGLGSHLRRQMGHDGYHSDLGICLLHNCRSYGVRDSWRDLSILYKGTNGRVGHRSPGDHGSHR